MVDGAAFAHRSNQSKGLAVSSSKRARSTASRPVPVGDSVPNSAGSNRRAPGFPNSDSVPHVHATIGFLQGLPPEPVRAVRIRGPRTPPPPAANATEIPFRPSRGEASGKPCVMAGQTPAYRPPLSAEVQTLFSTARGDRRPPLSEAEEQAKNPEVFLGCAAPGRESCPGRSPPVRRSAPPAASSLAVGPSAGCW